MDEKPEGVEDEKMLVRREKHQFLAAVRSVSEIHDRSRLTSSSRSSLCLRFLKSKDILVKS